MVIGFAMCGSFCTFSQVFPIMEQLAAVHEVIPIYSPAAYGTDTRFGSAQDHIRRAASICGRDPLHTIPQVEPIGPKKLLDALVIAPMHRQYTGKAGPWDRGHLRNHGC